jgi:hypothetical protein
VLVDFNYSSVLMRQRLGEFEQILLLALAGLGADVSGVDVREYIESRTPSGSGVPGIKIDLPGERSGLMDSPETDRLKRSLHLAWWVDESPELVLGQPTL